MANSEIIWTRWINDVRLTIELLTYVAECEHFRNFHLAAELVAEFDPERWSCDGIDDRVECAVDRQDKHRQPGIEIVYKIKYSKIIYNIKCLKIV